MLSALAVKTNEEGLFITYEDLDTGAIFTDFEPYPEGDALYEELD
jgi:hypothetical protein